MDYPELGRKITMLIESDSLTCAAGLLEISDRLPIAEEFSKSRDKVSQLISDLLT
jgi:hypothetical protein